MHVEVRVTHGQGELASLHRWLRADPEALQSTATDVRVGDPGPGEMGAGLEVLQLATGNGWSAASFVLALVTWRQTRRQRPGVQVRRGDTVIVLTECSEEEIQRAIRMLGETGDDGEGDEQ